MGRKNDAKSISLLSLGGSLVLVVGEGGCAARSLPPTHLQYIGREEAREREKDIYRQVDTQTRTINKNNIYLCSKSANTHFALI